MARRVAGGRRRVRQVSASPKRAITQYEHEGKTRKNNPPVGLVTPQTDREEPRKTYSYDPHLDPQLQWAGKAERTSFEVPVVSLHVHERIDPRTIIEAVRKRNGGPQESQLTFFESQEENPPLREAIDFYKHEHGWSNRLIAGDSLLVMNSLLEKEGMGGRVQVVYVDPPYGIKYGSNFQPFVNKRDVRDGRDEDLTQEPETIRAFRDTWTLGIHSYLTYLRDRLLLAHDLLNETGSCFVQISDQNVHLVRSVLDEVFGTANFCSLVSFETTTSQTSALIPATCDYLIWYSKDKTKAKFRELFTPKIPGGEGGSGYSWVELPGGIRRKLAKDEISNPSVLPENARLFMLGDLTSQRQGRPSGPGTAMFFPVEFDGKTFTPQGQRGWSTTLEGINRLKRANRIMRNGNLIYYVRYLDDFPYAPIGNNWTDTGSGFMRDKVYVVQTNKKVIERCLLLTTDPGDLVLDITCGSGTTAYVAEQWGRRWITCDTSRVATALAKQRLMTAVFDYYQLAQPNEGIASGLSYTRVRHVTLKSIANGEPPTEVDLYNLPLTDNNRVRVTGPFTIEAVPAPVVRPLEEDVEPHPADSSISRSGATLKQQEWRDELLRAGIRGKGGQVIAFSRVEPLGGTRYLHATAETKSDRPDRVVISFGPEHAPLEQRQVEMAWEEARTLNPKASIIVFAAFEFDPEAAKDIDELRQEKTGMTFLKAKMNGDLLTEDLKKKRASNESFWLIGQPDIQLKRLKDGDHKGQWQVEVRGFDYYNPKTGTIESGDTSKISMWLLDTDYDGRSLYPRQVFFPMAGPDDGWAKLAKNLRAEIDEARIECYRGTKSLSFEAGTHQRIGIKIIDDRGIESLRILALD